ncbi:MAG: toprim domain-containing protein, partial [Clostridia bacterium]|nr:toprim domain-containing protein [Clostridia bacterium]
FYDAVQQLAEMMNVPMPTIDDDSAKRIRQKKAERDNIIKLMSDAAKYYVRNLYTDTPQAKMCRDYISKRGLSKESITRFGIGCSLDFRSLVSHLHSLGYSTSLMQKAGVIGIDEVGKTYDFYGKRLIFPLINTDNEVLGFSGRLLESRDDLAKYKNTPQTPVFNKSEMVFAINLLKRQRELERKNGTGNFGGLDNVIIAEGQIDVITMHEYGFTNTVACLGTALTPMHARKIKQFSDNIILLMDGDSAGQKAALRSIDTLRNCGMNVRVATIPDGMDPDEFLRKYGADEMRKLLDNSVEGMDFKITYLASNYDLNSHSSRSQFIREALIVIKGLNDESERDIYLKMLQGIVSTPVEVLRADLNKIDIDKHKPYYERTETNAPAPKKRIPADAYNLADQYILASLLYAKPYAKLDECEGVEFSGTYRDLYQYILDSYGTDTPANISGVYSRFNVDDSPELSAVVNYQFVPDPLPEFYYSTCILKNIQRKYMRLKSELDSQCKVATTKEERNAILTQIYEIAKTLQELNIKLQQVSMRHTAKLNEYNLRTKKSNQEE